MKKMLLLAFSSMAFYFTHAQNTGIGTTTPQTRLHVMDSTNTCGVKVETANGPAAGLEAKAGGTNANYMRLIKNNTTVGGSIAGVPFDNAIHFIGGPDAGPILTGTISNNDYHFMTNNLHRMVINKSGNVGIGNNNPYEPLHLKRGLNVLFGDSMQGNGSKMMWVAAKSAFRCGALYSILPEEDKIWDTDSIGEFSIAMGRNTKARGEASFSTGLQTSALGYGSVSMGILSETQGWGAVSIGTGCRANASGSIAIGHSCFSEGSSSFAGGKDCTATGNFGSLSLGKDCRSVGNDGSFAIGLSNTVSGNEGSCALGNGCRTTGIIGSVSIGYVSHSNGNYGTAAIGCENRATGDYGAAAIGFRNLSKSLSETVVGSSNDTSDVFLEPSSSSWKGNDRIFTIGNGIHDILSGTSTRSNAMVVLKDGRVGIGTNKPTNLMHLSTTSGTNGGMQLMLTEKSAGYARIGFSNNDILGWVMGATLNTVAASSQFNIFSQQANADVLSLRGDGTACFFGNVKANVVTTCSDFRYKQNIQPLGNALKKVMQVNGVTYQYKQQGFTDKHFSSRQQLGFIAQELEAQIPEVVYTDSDGYKSVDYAKVTPLLLQAIKELKQEVDELKKQLNKK